MKPDIIIHHRVSDKANLFCLEAKKDYNWNHPLTGYKDMEAKLIGLTHPDDIYRYTMGLAWKIPESANPADHTALWFIDGEMKRETSLYHYEPELVELLRERYGE